MTHLPVFSVLLVTSLLVAACDSDESASTAADVSTSQADVIGDDTDDISVDTAVADTMSAPDVDDVEDAQAEVDSLPVDTQAPDTATQPDTSPEVAPDTAVDTNQTTDTHATSCTTVFEFNQFETLDITADTAPPAVYAMAVSPQTATTLDTIEFFTALNGQPEDDEQPSITVGVYTHVNGQGTGALLASGTVTVSETASWWRVSLDSPASLAGDQRYWVVFEPNASMILPWATVGSDDVPYIWGFGIGEWLNVGTDLQKPWMMKGLNCQ